MSTDLSRRTVLGAALAAPLTLPALATDAPAWESDAAAKLVEAVTIRRPATKRRNPFPMGQSATARHEWAQAYCAAFTAAGMSERIAAKASARAACEALCGN